MNWQRSACLAALGLGLLLSSVLAQPATVPPVPNVRRPGTDPGGPPVLPSTIRSGAVPGVPLLPQADSSARTYINQGQGYLAAGRLSEAKEALRTAIRLEPMSLEAWGLYDYVVESHYVGRSREEKINPVVDRDLVPLFAVTRVESYQEYDTLYLVGEVKNVSNAVKRRVEVTGLLLDENRQELRREQTFLTLTDRGIFPGESVLFEIAFHSPPKWVKSYRVRVSNFE
jgi:tetratricopeptide (TPR) repeat protein